MKPIAPCKDCEERYLGCHQNCKAYNKYKSDKKEKDILIKKKRNEMLIVDVFEKEKTKRLMKYK